MQRIEGKPGLRDFEEGKVGGGGGRQAMKLPEAVSLHGTSTGVFSGSKVGFLKYSNLFGGDPGKYN